MFNLEQAIEMWRREMRAAGVTGQSLEELESHLRDDVEHRVRAGDSAEAAYQAAVEALGGAVVLGREFAKAGGTRRAQGSKWAFGYCWASALFAVLTTGWAIFQSEMSVAGSILRGIAGALVVLYFLKLPYVWLQLSKVRNRTAREFVRFGAILAWPAYVYLVPAGASLPMQLVLIGFGALVPALVLVGSYGLGNGFEASFAPLSVPENFNSAARQSLECARAEAVQFGHDFIGTEHVLLGLLRTEEGLACTVLRKLGVRAETVVAAIAKEVGVGAAHGMQTELPATPRTERALQLASREATALKQASVGGEHILLGLLVEGSGVAARVLRKLGIEESAARREIRKASAA